MRGGLVFFRGDGSAARAYLESDHSHADEYYLEQGAAVASWRALDGRAVVVQSAQLAGEEYQAWVDWLDPMTGEQRGKARAASRVREDGSIKALPSSPRFVEMTVNADKSLSVAAALSPEVAAALDEAQQAAVEAMNAYMAEHSVTRIGALGEQRLVPVERLESVAVVHRSSRAGDPHRHVHVQWSTRVFAEGRWRGLHTAATLKQQGALRGVGEASINHHAGLRAALAKAGFEFDARTGTVKNLAAHAQLLSKRSQQIERNIAKLEREWRAAHSEREPDRVLRREWDQRAWSLERPQKRKTTERPEAKWLGELREAGLQVDGFGETEGPALGSLLELDRAVLAQRAVTAAEARGSAWSVADLEGFLGVEVGRHDVAATPAEVRAYVRDAAETIAAELPRLALDANGAVPEWVRQYTSERVLRVETELRERLEARGLASGLALGAGAEALETDRQQVAAQALATRAPLVVVEGAAGSGKTTMLRNAHRAAEREGLRLVVVAPTLRAAQEARQQTGVDASSAHKLAHEYGFRWGEDGRWTRLEIGDADERGNVYDGPSAAFRLDLDARVVVDEAGMVDQDLAHALVTVADETGAGLALIGDRQQLPAVGRGGVLDLAVAAHPRPIDMAEVHRFREAGYAPLTQQLRDRANPAGLFELLRDRGNVIVHRSAEAAQDQIVHDVVAKARAGQSVAVAVATNEQAALINARVQEARAASGLTRGAGVDVAGVDGLTVRRGDRLMTRLNLPELGVANRDTWTIERVHRDGSLDVSEGARAARLPASYVKEHTHLAYASTVYGVQGASVDFAHGVVDEGTSAQALYVAATRGREHNALHIVASDAAEAKGLFVAALERESGDRGTRAAVQAAQRDIAGLDLDAAPSVDESLRAERQAAERRRFQARHKAWRLARDRWQQENPGLDPDSWHGRYERAQAAAKHAEQELSRVRRAAADEAVQRRGAEWGRDWSAVDDARQARERAGMLGKRRAEQAVRAAEEAFAGRHDEPAMPSPSSATVARWREQAMRPAVTPAVYEADVRLRVVRNELEGLEQSKPPFSAEPMPPVQGTPAHEAAKDAAFRKRAQQESQRQQQRAAKAPTPPAIQRGPTLER